MAIKPIALGGLLFILSACAPPSRAMYLWRVREMALAPAQEMDLLGPSRERVATVGKTTMQRLLLAHFRVSRAAGVQAELFVADGKDPNAFATIVHGRPVIGVNLAMLKLIGDDVDEFASLLGHEVAHVAAGHYQSANLRTKTLEGLGTLLGTGLGMAGVPAAGTIVGLAADVVDASFSRDEERQADALGVGYVMAAGYNPEGGIRLHEKLLKQPRGISIPFFSSHPSSEERIENMRKLIGEKKKGRGRAAVSETSQK